ncbi:DUF3040 domain-containing protein [Streptacidiphilus rugosus]|uniref:DUF3040 domain-containing protein n=1 Tax=Streptacidiphilus rugosus TaxID=405783 RepID=UPI00055D450E|nr:DUF3040 domain-containing protein [Streptacidiphilus rugosus]
MNDRRVLAEIDRRLTASDPRLAARLGTLTRARFSLAAVRGAMWRRPLAVVSWNVIALAALLLVLAAAVHRPLLAGVGVVALLAGGLGATISWLEHRPARPTRRDRPDRPVPRGK